MRMHKKIFLASSLIMASTALADDKNFFFQLNGGLAVVKGTGLASDYVNKTPSTYGGKGASLSNSGVIGLEFGGKVSNKFRASVSIDYINAVSLNIADFASSTISGITQTKRMKSSFKIKSLTAMLNGYYDILEYQKFTPYLNFGVGVSSNVAKSNLSGIQDYLSSKKAYHYAVITGTSESKTMNNFAYKIGLGTKFRFSDGVDLDFRYQFVNLGKFKTSNVTGSIKNIHGTIGKSSTKGKLVSNQFLFGASYKF